MKLGRSIKAVVFQHAFVEGNLKKLMGGLNSAGTRTQRVGELRLNELKKKNFVVAGVSHTNTQRSLAAFRHGKKDRLV